MLPLLLLLPGFFSGLISEPVAVVEIHGFIGSDVIADDVVQTLEAIETGEYAAVILDIDSPGGSAVDSHKIVKALEKMTKPKVAVIGNAAVSGAYWVAAACDHIVSDELSFVGSIGATTQFFSVEGLAERYGVIAETIAYPENKAFGNIFKNMTPDERDYAQGMAESAGRYFQESVLAFRPEVSPYVDGLPYVAYKAPEMVDKFGGFNEAVAAAETLTGTNLDPEILASDTGIFGMIKKFSGLRSKGPFNLLELVFQVPYYL